MVTITSQHEVKSLKEHICNFCGLKINKGEIYMKSTHKYEGDIYDWKTHKHCADIAEKLKMYKYADEGVSMDFFTETIHDEHNDLMLAQLPLEGNEHGKFSDIISQLRKVPFKEKLWYVIRYYNKIDNKQIK